MFTIEQLQQGMQCTTMTASRWHGPLVYAAKRWGITKASHQAMWLGQIGLESGRLTRFEENLRYSALGLARTWPKRYAVLGSNGRAAKPLRPNPVALQIAGKPEKIANLTYANRGGNGDPASGDGWLFRGRGPKQVTFRDNYRRAGKALGVPLVEQPDLLLEPEHGAQAAGWYWADSGCGTAADTGDFLAVTRLINGGTIGHEDGNDWGLDDRVELWQSFKKAMGIV